MNAIGKISFEPAYRQLAPQEKAFVDEFVARIERAAELSGAPLADVLVSQDLSRLDDRSQAFLHRELVRAAISDRIRELTEAQNVSARRIMKSIAAVAFSSMENYLTVNEWGQPEFDFSNLTPEQWEAIKSVETTESKREGTVKVKVQLHDKLAALRMNGQIMGLFDENGDAANPEKWAEQGAIAETATIEDAASEYERFISI